MPQNKIVLRQNKSILRKIPYHFTARGGGAEEEAGTMLGNGLLGLSGGNRVGGDL